VIRGVRGAITINENTAGEILSATEQLAKEMIEANNIDPEKVASVFISVTEDVTGGFPAKALRSLNGWKFVPVMCMQEIPVPGGLPHCIRIMMHVNTDIGQQEIQHIYLRDAKVLRPDLVK